MTNGLGRRRFLALAAASAASAACAPVADPSGSGAGRTDRPTSPLAANPALDVWPDAYRAAPVEVREAYAYAAGRPRALSFIACYCGCTGSGHRSNQDCYVKQFRSGGWMILDPHGFT